MSRGKTYIVSANIEVEVCDCQDKHEALDIATDQIDLSSIDFEVEEAE